MLALELRVCNHEFDEKLNLEMISMKYANILLLYQVPCTSGYALMNNTEDKVNRVFTEIKVNRKLKEIAFLNLWFRQSE